MKTKISEEHVEAYKCHKMTIYDIAEKMCKSPSTIYNALRSLKIDTTSHRRRMSSRNKDIITTYQRGLVLEDIAFLFGLTKQCVREIIAREAFGILRSNKGRP